MKDFSRYADFRRYQDCDTERLFQKGSIIVELEEYEFTAYWDNTETTYVRFDNMEAAQPLLDACMYAYSQNINVYCVCQHAVNRVMQSPFDQDGFKSCEWDLHNYYRYLKANAAEAIPPKDIIELVA